MSNKKIYKIVIKEINQVIVVSKRTYYKIFNNEKGMVTNEGYEISFLDIKKYKKLYNGLRSKI